ncbi:hypothetical protein COLO4_35414 [Corchorus olitorius]|uniref:Uncharacterized protein n=1 Tax=Corchorus olitorius TaxID=93759 RepID=A0A1R3GH34_9ROSI|nr:hypothetical protein COLO4_35414 [Corchorus olitorius]
MAAICFTWFTVMEERLDEETIHNYGVPQTIHNYGVPQTIHNYGVPLTILVTGIVVLTATSSIFLLKGFLCPCDPYKAEQINITVIAVLIAFFA